MPKSGHRMASKGPAIIAIPIDYAENMKMTKRLGELAFTI